VNNLDGFLSATVTDRTYNWIRLCILLFCYSVQLKPTNDSKKQQKFFSATQVPLQLSLQHYDNCWYYCPFVFLCIISIYYILSCCEL